MLFQKIYAQECGVAKVGSPDLQKGRAQRKRARPFVYHGAGSDRQTDAFTVVQGLAGPGTVALRAGGRRWQPVVRSSSSEA